MRSHKFKKLMNHKQINFGIGILQSLARGFKGSKSQAGVLKILISQYMLIVHSA